MKIKSKLYLGIGFLFLLLLTMSVVSTKYINGLKMDTNNILVDNYKSLEYSRNMILALQNTDSNALKSFEKNLKLQEKNITEIGEDELTSSLHKNFNSLKNNPNAPEILHEIRADVLKIMNINMLSIQRKSDLANHSAAVATNWIAITAALCFLLSFVLLVNLPSSIANPLKELTQSILQISDKNYHQRVHFQRHDEFGDLARSFNVMAKKLQEYNESNLAKLMMEKKRIDTLIDHMNDPLIGLDEQLIVQFANEKAYQILGLKKDNFIGKSIKDIALHNDLIRILTQDLLVVSQQQHMSSKTLKIYDEGRESYFEKEFLNVSNQAEGQGNEDVIGHFIILRNVTTYKELDFAKTNFIATVSHEFKTPISAIKMSVQLLENENIGTTNEEQKKLLDSINDDAHRLLKITDELLNMSQVESGNIQLSLNPICPSEMISYAIKANQTQATQRQIDFEVDVKDDAKVLADSDKTAWVLVNLISNAIRYSHENTAIKITVNSDGENTQIKVKDHGQGIAPQYLDKVFDRYFRVPDTKREGSGLGLAISKEFMEAQNGSISLQSELGVGSEFSIYLKSIKS